MKTFITGIGGQLGHDVMDELAKHRYEDIGSNILKSLDTEYPYVQLDVTDAEVVEKVISELTPDVVIHCSTWTAVDAAEDEENKPKVKAINVDSTQNIANICKKLDCKMYTFRLTTFSTVRERIRVSRIAKTMHHRMSMVSPNLMVSLR